MPDGQKSVQPFEKEKTNVKNTLRKIIPQGQSVENPRIGRLRPQTALRWFAGKALRHKV